MMRCRITKSISSDFGLSQIEPGEYDYFITRSFSRQYGYTPAVVICVNYGIAKIGKLFFDDGVKNGAIELLKETNNVAQES